MAEEIFPESGDPDLEIVNAGSDDPGTELLANIEVRLKEEFPDLERRPEVIHTIETVVRERSFMFSGPNPPLR